MKKLLFGLLILSGLFASVSFADYTSELQSCNGGTRIKQNSCIEKVYKKYVITKEKACNMKDGIISHQPIQTSWSKEKTMTERFFKYNRKLFYQVAVSSGGIYDYPNNNGYVRSYFYMYDCQKKIASDLSKKFPKNIGVMSSHDMVDNTLTFTSPLQNNSGFLLFSVRLQGPGSDNYYILDVTNYLLTSLDISLFKNYDIRRNKVISSIELPQDGPVWYISHINKNFVGDIFVDDGRQMTKINLLTKTITTEK